ncbi:hypothetical protein J132_06663 [Termitomyces sp. J132]|nr:hypothetical protein J132_06663 [Termitomyces sp. J132]
MHNKLAHRGLFATRTALLEHFWWPHISANIAWYIHTCHLCQIHQTSKVLTPPTVAMPAPLFIKIYVDTMFMPSSNKFKEALVWDSPGVTAGEWVVTPSKEVPLNHIHMLGYNKHTNSIVEQPHFDIQQALFKAVYGNQSKWSSATYSVFCSECIIVCKHMGCSPYEDLQKLHNKVFSAFHQAAICFKKEHATTIHNYDFKHGDLIITYNTRIEVTHNKEMCPCYLGPLLVILS